MKKKKINKFLLILGLVGVCASILAGRYITEGRSIKLNGDIVKARIIRFRKGLRQKEGAYVELNGKEFYISGLRKKRYSLGDTILVRFIPGKNRVIPEHYKVRVYYLYYAFDLILFLMGAVLVIESFKGKSMWSYYK